MTLHAIIRSVNTTQSGFFMTSELDSKDLRILNDLFHMAQDVVPVTGAKLAAAIAIRGHVKSWGTNQWRTHPFQQRFGKNEFSPFWHAETNAIHNYLRRYDVSDLQRATLYVVRVKRPSERSREWVTGMAKPCRGCRSCIYNHGITRVVWSNDHVGYSCEGEF